MLHLLTTNLNWALQEGFSMIHIKHTIRKVQLFLPFYRWADSLKRLSDLPKVRQQKWQNWDSNAWTICFQSPNSYHCIMLAPIIPQCPEKTENHWKEPWDPYQPDKSAIIPLHSIKRVEQLVYNHPPTTFWKAKWGWTAFAPYSNGCWFGSYNLRTLEWGSLVCFNTCSKEYLQP